MAQSGTTQASCESAVCQGCGTWHSLRGFFNNKADNGPGGLPPAHMQARLHGVSSARLPQEQAPVANEVVHLQPPVNLIECASCKAADEPSDGMSSTHEPAPTPTQVPIVPASSQMKPCATRAEQDTPGHNRQSVTSLAWQHFELRRP